MNIRDRIKELRRVRAGDLRPHPKNWRTHPEEQQNALRGILAEVGFVDALMVRELPDGLLQIVDGHLWQVKKVPSQKSVHLTEKPVELAARAMKYSSRAGENVLDLFGGSGSTLMAAEQTGRKAFLMELDPPYCDVIVERFEKFTGKKAERIAAEAPA